MLIANHDLNKDVLLIAEVGNCHEGDHDLAKRMIALAAKAGAHVVKFQTIRPELLIDSSNQKRLAQLKKFQFSYTQFAELATEAANCGVQFMSTPFDLESAQFLAEIMPAFKIASSDNNFFPLLEIVAKTGKPVILSTGLATIEDIRKSKDFIEAIWKANKCQQELAVLHCVTAYPTPPEQANLLAIRTLHQALGCTSGYSDHTLGIEACLLAVALGARIIEKHFTIDKNHSSFRDHQLSADPADLEQLAKRIKEVTTLLGSGTKELQQAEMPFIIEARRSICAKTDLQIGHTIRLEDLTWLRPGGGIPPGQEVMLIGKKLTKAVTAGEKFSDQM